MLRPQDLAALASVGRSSVDCYRRLRVAVVASGDEIVAPGAKPLAPGEVYDANTPMLQALLPLAGVSADSLGIWADDAALVRTRLAEAAATYDVVITTGGASRGEEDHMAGALAALGTPHLLATRDQARPADDVRCRSPPAGDPRPPCLVVGLPGNPVAVLRLLPDVRLPAAAAGSAAAPGASRGAIGCRRPSISRVASPAGGNSGAACWSRRAGGTGRRQVRP